MDNQTTNQNTPDAFKAMIIAKYPNGVSSNGTKYADMSAQDLTQKIVSKYPNGTTNAGIPYSAYLQNQSSPSQTTKPSNSYSGLLSNPLSMALGGGPISGIGLLKYAANSIKNAAQSGWNQMTGGVSDIQNANQQGGAGGFVKGLEGGVKTVAGGVGALLSPFAPITQPISDASNYLSDKISNIPQVQKFANTPVGQGTARVAEDVDNLNTLAGGALGLEGAVRATPKVVDEGILPAAAKTKQAFSPTLSPEEATGQIIQGKTGDIPAAQRTLNSIDTSNVKTYTDLQNKLNSEIKPLVQKVDAEFDKDTSGGHSIKSFEQTIGTGKSAIKVNYVQQAITQLKDFYSKTGDAKGLSDMKILENKAKINGLTYKDVNNLARTHGIELNAYNQNGELASGLTKQAAENTRVGLKNTARNGLGTSQAKALDAKLSDLYDTKALIDKQVEKVNATSQKTAKQGIIPKYIGKGVGLLDTLTGSPLKAIGHTMGNPGSTGLLSPVDIEANLAKNLKIIKGK